MIRWATILVITFQLHQNIKGENNLIWPNGQKPEPYSPELLEKAKAGDACAQFSVGFAFLGGEGVIKNEKEAATWFGKSAEQGNALAQGYLGFCYIDGKGVNKDKKKGFKWLKKSADKGDAINQRYIGEYYIQGTGVDQNKQEGINYYKKSAEQGLPMAQYELGVFYVEGNNVEKNESEGIKLISKAADQNEFENEKFAAVNWLVNFYKAKYEKYVNVQKELDEQLKKKKSVSKEESPSVIKEGNNLETK